MDLDIEFAASDNWDERMWERLRWLQEHEPVYWSEKDRFWVVTRFDDVAWVSKHQEIFTSGLGVRPGNPAHLGLIDEGEPRHGELRGLINKGFTPRMVKKLEIAFREITREAIDAPPAWPQRRCFEEPGLSSAWSRWNPRARRQQYPVHTNPSASHSPAE